MRKALGIAAALAGVQAVPVSSQIVVGSGPAERPPKPGLIFCQANSRGETYYSGQVWGDRNNASRSPLKEAFASFVRSQYGARNPEVSCYGENFSAEPNPPLPGITFTRFTGGLPTSGPGSGSRPPIAAVTPPQQPSRTLPPTATTIERPAEAQPPRQPFIDSHTAAAEENRKRQAAHAEAMRRHQEQVAAAAEARRQHEQQLASAKAAQDRYQQELAAHEALVKSKRTQAERDQLVEWKEAVTVCAFEKDNPQSRLGNWTCHGPLQHTYVKLGDTGTAVTPGGIANIAMACGSSRESVRDLGMVGGYHLFGCSFGLHPAARQALHRDQAARFGISYVPGRIAYRCPTHVSYCRTR